MKIAFAALVFLTASFPPSVQTKLPVFGAAVVEKEDPAEMEDWGLGCSIYCALDAVTQRASSSLAHRRGLKYGPEQAHDFKLNTAWVEGADGDGVGEFLEYTIDLSASENPSLTVTSLTVFNGYRKSRELWQDNSRVKRLKMYVDGKPYGLVDLKDAYNFQTVGVGEIRLPPKKRTVLRFEIVEVYKGRKYADTAITELELDGGGAH